VGPVPGHPPPRRAEPPRRHVDLRTTRSGRTPDRSSRRPTTRIPYRPRPSAPSRLCVMTASRWTHPRVWAASCMKGLSGPDEQAVGTQRSDAAERRDGGVLPFQVTVRTSCAGWEAPTSSARPCAVPTRQPTRCGSRRACATGRPRGAGPCRRGARLATPSRTIGGKINQSDPDDDATTGGLVL